MKLICLNNGCGCNDNNHCTLDVIRLNKDGLCNLSTKNYSSGIKESLWDN